MFFNIIEADSTIHVAQWTNQDWTTHSEFYFVKLKPTVIENLFPV